MTSLRSSISESVSGSISSIRHAFFPSNAPPTATANRRPPDDSPHVLATAKVTSTFRLCAADPVGDDTDDWATCRVDWQQTYRIYGGGDHPKDNMVADHPLADIALEPHVPRPPAPPRP